MPTNIYSKITNSGCYIPKKRIPNQAFLKNSFYDEAGEIFDKKNTEIIEKFKAITEIEERRYVDDDMVTSDIGFLAAENALASAPIDKEELDYIIVAHNFGDVQKDNPRSDFVPTLAARIKHRLEIENPNTIPYDLPFGCPGWLQGLIQADYYIRSGDARHILVIGAETLSRVSDPHDRDSMLYSDGAGAVLLSAEESDHPIGILSHRTRSDTQHHAFHLRMERSYKKDYNEDNLFLKMQGRKLYEYALNTVPELVKKCLDKADIALDEIKKVLLHQANGKMDAAILKRLFYLYGKKSVPEDIMPMTISWMGNNSVATLPILFDLLQKQKLNGHALQKGDHLLFASVGAGMNINALVYKHN